MVGIPLKQDSFNSGMYIIWCLLMEYYKGKEMVNLDPETFREQLLSFDIFF